MWRGTGSFGGRSSGTECAGRTGGNELTSFTFWQAKSIVWYDIKMKTDMYDKYNSWVLAGSILICNIVHVICRKIYHTPKCIGIFSVFFCFWTESAKRHSHQEVEGRSRQDGGCKAGQGGWSGSGQGKGGSGRYPYEVRHWEAQHLVIWDKYIVQLLLSTHLRYWEQSNTLSSIQVDFEYFWNLPGRGSRTVNWPAGGTGTW